MALIKEAEELLGDRSLSVETRNKILAVILDSEHWKANHKNMVDRCALLSQRPDMLVDRIPAYREMIRLQETVAKLTKHNTNMQIELNERMSNDLKT